MCLIKSSSSCCDVSTDFPDTLSPFVSIVYCIRPLDNIPCRYRDVVDRFMDTTAIWKKLHFILSDRSNFHMTDTLSIAVHAFANRILMPFSIDKTLLPRYVNSSTSFRERPFSVETSLF